MQLSKLKWKQKKNQKNKARNERYERCTHIQRYDRKTMPRANSLLTRNLHTTIPMKGVFIAK